MICYKTGNDLDLDQNILGQAGHFHGAAGGRESALGSHVLPIDGIHGGEVVHVAEIHGGLHDLSEARAALFEDGLQVLQNTGGLLGDAATDHLLGGRIERNLPRGEDQVSQPDGLRIRPDRLGRMRGRNFFFRHGKIVELYRQTASSTPTIIRPTSQ